MAEEPEHMLPEQRLSATFRQKEAGSERAVEEQHRQRRRQNRKRKQQQNRGDE